MMLSSHGNNLYDAIALLDEWNRAFFGLLGVTKNTTHPIFSLSNYNGLPQLNRPLAPAYLVIMQRAAQLGYLSLCFEMLHHLVDQNALIDKLASEESERSRMRARLSTFQPLAVPLNTYITLYQACKTTTDQTIDQRRHLLQQLHTYFIAQPSFAVIKGRDTVLLHTKSAAAPSPNQVLLILSTFLTVTEDIGKVLRVWQELRVKFRKCSGWNRVERFSAIRKVIFDCRDELQKESKKSKDGIDSKDSKDNAWSDIDHEQAIQRRKHPEIPKTHPQHITPNQPI
ncbi:hypothetical protein J056_000310 [Wallemia ichthyophaga EXF-994]|uniref:Uncharacterized protein n=1 Tax=Wallemia ichthyophaga (strain EXF-994 / CBS 113033) TaxID=1299270 RepID=R9ASC4_WALI9|nr:uncharacterized protein J056_000310 [Wallemia ichthyophaga EXF-994]EOR04950.1 hypothetical protein J056_000310 [Wallemia ichthyophaga EXF-994]